MAHAGTRVSKMAIRCIWVTTSPESPTFLPGEDIVIGNRTRMEDNRGRYRGEPISGTARFGDSDVVDGFLNGSAPRRLRLRHLDLLHGIPFPESVPQLLLSATGLFPLPSSENSTSSFRVHIAIYTVHPKRWSVASPR